MSVTDATPAEVMVSAAARYITDGQIVFVGMRLPLLAFALAKHTRAPSAVGVFEAGLVRDTPAEDFLYTMADSPNVFGSMWATGLWEVMSYLQRGDVDLGFIGGAEVDQRGNLNTSYIGDPDHPQTKLPGSGGAADIAALAKRFVIIIQHGRHRLRQTVDYVTSPGYGESRDWRDGVGLAGQGPLAIITTLGVFEFQDGEAILASRHPSTDVDEIRSNTGWDLKQRGPLSVTPNPTAEELDIIRHYDPTGFWTGQR